MSNHLLPPPPPPPVLLPPGLILPLATNPPLPTNAPPPPPPPPLPPIPTQHTVLLTHIPKHLADSNGRSIRDLVYPCGTSRFITVASTSSKTRKSSNPKKHGLGSVAIVRMSTSHGANSVARSAPPALQENGVRAYNYTVLSRKLQDFERREQMLALQKSAAATGVTSNGIGFVIDGLVGSTVAKKATVATATNILEEEEKEKEAEVVKEEEKEAPSDGTTAAEPVVPSEEASTLAPVPPNPMDPHNSTIRKMMEISAALLEKHNLPKSDTHHHHHHHHNSSFSQHAKMNAGGVTAAPDDTVKKLDVSRVAAAAGGGEYNEEEDPLNAPEVLEAVAKFKKSLEGRDSGMRKRRVDIVDKMIEDAMAVLRKKKLGKEEEDKKMKEETRSAPQREATNTTDTAQESSKRAVSNLPAWMTKGAQTAAAEGKEEPPQDSTTANSATGQKRKFIPSEANRDINARKPPRLDITGDLSSSARTASPPPPPPMEPSLDYTIPFTSLFLFATSPPPPTVSLSPDHGPTIETWIKEKIVDLLGEEESTLIKFILDQILTKKNSPLEVLEELKLVLDEDAEEFVLDLWNELRKLKLKDLPK